MSIMQKARQSGAFQRPDISQFIPPGQEDTVARVAAAGQKVMYSPGMRDELNAEVARDAPVPQKMAESVTGLMLTLDAQTPGGIPQEALFPAALDLLAEAAEVLSQAGGAPVTREEYNEAAMLLFVMMSKKLGISDEDIMGAAETAAGVAEEGQAAPEQGAPPETKMPPPEEDEEAAMREGFQ